MPNDQRIAALRESKSHPIRSGQGARPPAQAAAQRDSHETDRSRTAEGDPHEATCDEVGGALELRLGAAFVRADLSRQMRASSPARWRRRARQAPRHRVLYPRPARGPGASRRRRLFLDPVAHLPARSCDLSPEPASATRLFYPAADLGGGRKCRQRHLSEPRHGHRAAGFLLDQPRQSRHHIFRRRGRSDRRHSGHGNRGRSPPRVFRMPKTAPPSGASRSIRNAVTQGWVARCWCGGWPSISPPGGRASWISRSCMTMIRPLRFMRSSVSIAFRCSPSSGRTPSTKSSSLIRPRISTFSIPYARLIVDEAHRRGVAVDMTDAEGGFFSPVVWWPLDSLPREPL